MPLLDTTMQKRQSTVLEMGCLTVMSHRLPQTLQAVASAFDYFSVAEDTSHLSNKT